jgi:hypothetical protein
MRRSIVVVWHAVSFILAAGLYFFFVLPRWQEFAGHVSSTVGTTMRIVAGVLLVLTALPVLLNLRRCRRPEFGAPRLALNLRTWSIVAHVLAGVTIVATAIVEMQLGLDKAGTWLFGAYGAAAALALLGALALYAAFAAESTPRPPKPIKPKKEKRRGRRTADVGEVPPGSVESPIIDSPVEGEAPAEVAGDQPEDDDTDNAPEPSDVGEDEADPEADEAVLAAPRRRLLNRRSAVKGRHGGVALSD